MWDLNIIPPAGESAVASSHLNHGGPKQKEDQQLTPWLTNHPQSFLQLPALPSPDLMGQMQIWVRNLFHYLQEVPYT